jgi:hypothetical protein
VRRLTALTTGLLTAVTLVGAPALVGTGSAAPVARPAGGHATEGHAEAAEHEAAGHEAVARPAAKPDRAARPAPTRTRVTVVGVVTATPTVQTATSGTATVVVGVRVRGGDRAYRGRTVQVTVTAATVVKRDHGRKTRYELRLGDKVTVLARRDAAGVLTATSIAVSGRPAPVTTAPAASGTVR